MSRSLKYIILLCYFCVTILLFENSVRDKFSSADLYPHVQRMAFLELPNFLDIYE